MSKSLISLSLLILLGFIWGTGYSIARFATTNGVPPLGYSFWQSLGPCLFIAALLTVKREASLLTWSNRYYYLICGLTGIVIPNTCMYFAAPHLPAGILAMVVNTVPVIAYPIALLARLEQFSWWRITGIFLASLGLLCIILPQSSLPSSQQIPWVFFSLITPFSFACCATFIAAYKPVHNHSLALSLGMLLASSILLLPIVFFSHSFYSLHFPFNLADWVIVLEIILSSIGYILFFQLIKIAGPVYYSLVDTVVVLSGIFWGHLLFKEQLNQWTFTAVFLILLALVLVTQQQRTTVSLKQALRDS